MLNSRADASLGEEVACNRGVQSGQLYAMLAAPTHARSTLGSVVTLAIVCGNTEAPSGYPPTFTRDTHLRTSQARHARRPGPAVRRCTSL